MKHRIKRLLQSLLGFEHYLFIFALYKILTLRFDKGEGSFLQFLDFVPDDGLVLDIGANIGIMTVRLARKAQRGVVHAFEPMPVNFRVLERVVRWFGLKNVVLHRWALGVETSEVEMVMPIVDSVRLQGLSYVVGGGAEPLPGELVRVPCKRLDELENLFPEGMPVAAIKIDVQDFEYQVFDGARDLLRRFRPAIYCELGQGENRTRTLALFADLRYEFKVLRSGGLVAFDSIVHADEWNFFLLPRS